MSPINLISKKTLIMRTRKGVTIYLESYTRNGALSWTQVRKEAIRLGPVGLVCASEILKRKRLKFQTTNAQHY